MQLHSMSWKGEDGACSEAFVCPCVAGSCCCARSPSRGNGGGLSSAQAVHPHSLPPLVLQHELEWIKPMRMSKTHHFLGRRKLANRLSFWGFPKLIQICRSEVQYQSLQTDWGFPNLNQVCRDKVQCYSLQTDHVVSSLCVNGNLCVYKLYSFLSFLWFFF